jgi:flagellar protein FlaI
VALACYPPFNYLLLGHYIPHDSSNQVWLGALGNTPWFYFPVGIAILALLWIAVQFKRNVLIIGETASGKTTLLNAISLFIPKTSKIVSIEDTREINLPFENWIPAVSRVGVGINKIGEITLFDLLKASLRQNPDYIIVGEVRGEEANVLFQGMASGHCSFATFHANNVNSVISRLTTPPINLPSSLISLLDLIVLTAHYPNKGRKIKEINEIYSTKEKLINQNVVGKYSPLQDQFFINQTINLFKKIEDFYGISVEELWNELEIRAKLLKTMSLMNINWKTFSDIVNLYYIDKKRILNMFLKA